MPQYQSDLAVSHANLGEVLKKTGHHAEAEQAYRQAIALQEKLVAESPSVPQYRSDLASNYANLGNLLRDLGRRAEAEQAVPPGHRAGGEAGGRAALCASNTGSDLA